MSLHPLPVATKSSRAGLLSLRSFRNVAVAAALPLSLLCAGRAEAISTVTQTITNTTPATPFNLLTFSTTSPQSTSKSYSHAFNKFNANLGKLVGVRIEGDGDLLGSFRAARSSNNTPSAQLTGATTTLNVTFGGPSGWSTNNTGGAMSFANTTTPIALSSATAVQLAAGTHGTLLASTGPLLTLSDSTNLNTYLSLFEGTGTINGDFTWTVNMSTNNLATSGTCGASVMCTGFNFAPTSPVGTTALYGDINQFKLTYEFIPDVPGPLPILGSGVAFAYSRRLRRRIQKASFTS